MSYQKTVWKNREVERPRTYNIQENEDGTITLIPAEGAIIEPGTPITAQVMQNIEDGIEVLDNTLKSHLADYETHKAEYETFTTVSITRNKLRVVEGSIFAQKIGKLVIITFEYNPSLNSDGFSKYDTNILTVTNYRPKYKVAGSAYPDNSVDINHRIEPYITQSGAIGVVNNLSNNTDSGAWTCTLVYLTD